MLCGIGLPEGTRLVMEKPFGTDAASAAARAEHVQSVALRALQKEAVVTFKQPPWVPTGLTGYDRPDRLRIGFDPGRLCLDLNINGPDDPSVIEPVTLEASLGPDQLPPYGEVLRGVFEGDPTLSVRGDTAVECWRIVEPVLEVWRHDEVPLQEYPAGATGPEEWPMPQPHDRSVPSRAGARVRGPWVSALWWRCAP